MSEEQEIETVVIELDPDNPLHQPLGIRDENTTACDSTGGDDFNRTPSSGVGLFPFSTPNPQITD